MSIFLVDYENVSASGLDGLEKLTEEDVVYIFYTENADRLTFDAHRRLLESRAAVRYYKVESGTKNALDFQLVSFLGYLIRENGSSAYYIISKDNGFDSVLHFWTKQPRSCGYPSWMWRIPARSMRSSFPSSRN